MRYQIRDSISENTKCEAWLYWLSIYFCAFCLISKTILHATEIDVILDGLCNSKNQDLSFFERQQLINDSKSLSRELLEIVLHSQMISLSDLCIESEKAVWILFIDILCICDDGNLFDACLLAVMAALKCLIIPHTLINKNDGLVYIDNRPEMKDSFYHLPLMYDLLPLSCLILDKKIICDPTADEMQLISNQITVVFNNSSEQEMIHFHVRNGGNEKIVMSQLQDVIHLAIARSKVLSSILNEVKHDIAEK